MKTIKAFTKRQMCLLFVCAMSASPMLGAISPMGGVARRPQATRNDKIGAKVDAYLQPYLKMKAFSGAILIARKGKVLLSRGYGMANYEFDVPNTPQTKFHIASVSKIFTAAAIMILEERGLLSFNDPLNKYIPDYPNGEKITVHHLLTHRSGIPNLSGPDYDERSKSAQTLTSVIESFKNRPLTMQPGERFSYSNSNYEVLAFIIEKVSDKSYGEFLKENIFDPLGMKDTGHDGNAAAIIKNRALGYATAGLDGPEKVGYLDFTIKTGSGSLYTTVADLYKWDLALNTEKILKKSSLHKMFAEPYSWFVGQRFNRRVFYYGGRVPGFQAELHRYVDDDVCIIVLSNFQGGLANLMANDMAAIALGEKYQILQLEKSSRVGPTMANAYIGRYRGEESFIRPNEVVTVDEKEGQLFLHLSPEETSALLPETNGKFYDRKSGAQVTFVKDETGKVSYLVMRFGEDYRARRIEDK